MSAKVFGKSNILQNLKDDDTINKEGVQNINEAVNEFKNMIVSTNNVNMKVIIKYSVGDLGDAGATVVYEYRILMAWFKRKLGSFSKLLLEPFIDFITAFRFYCAYKSIDTNIKFDSKTKKIYCFTPPSFEVKLGTYATGYLLTKRQIIAFLLHEFGHNFYYKNLAIKKALDGLSFIIPLGTLTFLCNKYFINKEEILSSTWKKIFVFVGIIMIFLKFLQCYYERAAEIDADDFAIKCGYGEDLIKTFEIINQKLTYIRDRMKEQNFIKSGIFDKIASLIDKFSSILSPFKYHRLEHENIRAQSIRSRNMLDLTRRIAPSS